MRKCFEKILDVTAEFIKSLISRKNRSYYELSENSEETPRNNPIRAFLSEKVRIKMDVEISRGVLILIISAIVLLLILIIKGLVKGSKK